MSASFCLLDYYFLGFWSILLLRAGAGLAYLVFLQHEC